MLAYDIDALQLMYNISVDPRSAMAWQSTVLSSSEKGKVLVKNSMLPKRAGGDVVLGLFVAWASLALCDGAYGVHLRVETLA